MLVLLVANETLKYYMLKYALNIMVFKLLISCLKGCLWCLGGVAPSEKEYVVLA